MNKETFYVKGLGGKKTLNGKVKIHGAKNAVLKAMAAAVLFKDKVHIKNVPQTEDVKKLSKLMSIAGINVVEGSKKDLTISAQPLRSTDLDHDISQAMRASVVLTGPLLARYGKVSFPAPGGCVIGARPVDLFIMAYEKMGAKVEIVGERYVITAPGKKLKGADIFFNIQTVGGTETLMMAAVLARGKTILRNCAMEPEIKSLAEYLVSCGAKIKGIGTTTMEITGGKLLNSKGKPYVTIPDRIETGSFLLLGALCADNLTIEDCDPTHVEVLTNMLRESGVPLEIGKKTISIKDNAKTAEANAYKSFSVRTHEYPGFPTDLQAPVVTYLTQTEGESTIFETIYEGRFKYTQDLIKMGANITVMNPREILVRGSGAVSNSKISPLKAPPLGEDLEARDIRAGFAIVMAALAAEGDSKIQNVYFIDRGYEALETCLTALGAKIYRIREGQENILV